MPPSEDGEEPTPLSEFFAEYGPPGFSYQPDNAAYANFKRLCKAHKWGQKQPEREKARNRLCVVLVIQFQLAFPYGRHSLTARRKLCTVLGIDPVPQDMAGCQTAVRNTHVNIFDLIDALMTGQTVRVFPTEKELAKYTKRSDKVFPKDKAYRSGLLRELLREISSPPGDEKDKKKKEKDKKDKKDKQGRRSRKGRRNQKKAQTGTSAEQQTALLQT